MAEVVHRLVERPGPGQQSEARNREGNIPPSLRASRGARPPQQRARVLLNLYASMCQHHPLSDALLLLDTPQNPPFASFPTDGMAPTFTTTSHLWCLSARRYLLTLELAALMGLDTQKLKLAGQSEHWFRKTSGSSSARAKIWVCSLRHARQAFAWVLGMIRSERIVAMRLVYTLALPCVQWSSCC